MFALNDYTLLCIELQFKLSNALYTKLNVNQSCNVQHYNLIHKHERYITTLINTIIAIYNVKP